MSDHTAILSDHTAIPMNSPEIIPIPIPIAEPTSTSAKSKENYIIIPDQIDDIDEIPDI